MSVLNKKPFIQSVLDDLDSHAVSALISVMNGIGQITKVKLGSSAFIALKNTNHGISHIILNVDNLREVTGYLIYNDSHCVFIAYDNRSNHLTQTRIDSSFNMEVVKEDLTVEELRQVCGDRVADIEVGDVVAGDINSENATAGKVLMADGEGGAEWGEVASAVSITYAALKTLRDGGNLIPGTFYRITDFVTTTAIFGTHSAGHQFDVIVRADSASVLNENAWAIQHEGDTYFANSKLSAWRLWYCLDNDTNRFAWADITNGKGVIYRMIDEFNNDIPYDFKNIIYEERPGFTYSAAGYNYLFARDSSLDANGYYGWRTTGGTPYGLSNPYCFTTVETPSTSMVIYSDTSGSVPGYVGIISEVFTETYDWYTFTVNNMDGSLLKSNNIYGNVMKPWTSGLNKNIFKGTGCHSNIFEENCYSNTFGQDFDNNVFGDSCYSNTFGNSCHRNLIGNECYKNTFANYCSNNKFGNDCCNNTFDGNCSFNVFVSNCQGNTFAGNCSFNTFDIGCFNNTFGKSCSSITFCNDCDYIALGNSSTATLYYEHITIDNGCRYLSILANGAGAYNSRLQNVHICSGVKGASNQNPLTITTDRGLAYETTYKATGSTEVIL